MSKQYARLDKEKAVCLLVDHQTGLFSLVQDFAPSEFKNNVLALADCAKFFGLPTVLTTSLESGPNGPLLPEIRKMFPDAPFVARPGQINAWDNEEFVAAVGKTGRKQLLIAGIVRCLWSRTLPEPLMSLRVMRHGGVWKPPGFIW